MPKTKLNHAEELELIRDAQAGPLRRSSRRSMDRLVRANMGLVHKIVSKVQQNATCSREDLINEGVLGFMHAVRKFDTTRGYRLSTYSYNWIYAYVRKYQLNNFRSIRLPAHVANANASVHRAIEHLSQDLGRMPNIDEVCSVVDGADNILCQALFTVSLNALAGEDSEVLDTIKAPEATSEAEIDVYFLLDKLRGQVSDRDFGILVQRFGLDGAGERTLQELAETNDISRARAHQIEKQCLNRLRAIA